MPMFAVLHMRTGSDVISYETMLRCDRSCWRGDWSNTDDVTRCLSERVTQKTAQGPVIVGGNHSFCRIVHGKLASDLPQHTHAC